MGCAHVHGAAYKRHKDVNIDARIRDLGEEEKKKEEKKKKKEEEEAEAAACPGGGS